jgi:hypothetical protein
MTTVELFNALQAAPSDVERARILEATAEDEREALEARIAYEQICSRAPLDALLARLDACVDDNARAAVLSTADPDAMSVLQLELKMAVMNTSQAAEFYLHMVGT